MGKIKIMTAVLLLILLLSGCERHKDITLSYGDGGFECEVSWERGGEMIRAVMICSEVSDAGERDVELRFAEPAAMKGLIVRRCGETVVAELYGEQIIAGDMSGWLGICELFDTSGKMSYLGSEEINGVTTDIILIEGGRSDDREVCLDRYNGLPVKIRGYLDSERVEAEIIYFNVRS